MPNEDNLFEDVESLIIDPNKDYYAEYTGPGGKFHHEDENEAKKAIGRAKAEADALIVRQQRETKELRDELATRIKYEEFLDKLTSAPPPSNRETPSQGELPSDNPAMTSAELDALVEAKLNQHDQTKTARQNVGIVKDKLTQAYGPNYAQQLRKQAAELEVSEQFVRNLSATNPKALFRLLGLEEGQQRVNEDIFSSPPRTQITTNFNTGNKRGKSYFDEIRKKDLNEYMSAKIHNEMFDRIKEMGVENFNKS